MMHAQPAITSFLEGSISTSDRFQIWAQGRAKEVWLSVFYPRHEKKHSSAQQSVLKFLLCFEAISESHDNGRHTHALHRGQHGTVARAHGTHQPALSNCDGNRASRLKRGHLRSKSSKLRNRKWNLGKMLGRLLRDRELWSSSS